MKFNDIFQKNNRLSEEWSRIKQRKKDFTWPDKPVLFDYIGDIFINEGLKSTLMYFHNSPGLLRVKKTAAYDTA